MQEKTFLSNSPEGQHTVTYYMYGDEGQYNKTVLCVHGLARFGRDFEFLANDLVKNGFRVIALDVVGRGKSGRLQDYKHYSYDQYLKDIWRLLDIETVGILDAWIGTSMGGTLGMMAFNQHPKRIKALVLNDIGAYIPDDAFEYVERFLTVNEPNRNWDEFYGLFQKRMRSFGKMDETAMRHLAEISAKHLDDGRVMLNYDTNIVHGLLHSEKQRKSNDFWHEWNDITCPVLILRGEESIFFQKDTIEQMKRTNKNVESVIIKNCGHAPSLTTIEQITPIRNWLLKT